MTKTKVSPATDIVQRAQRGYPQNLDAVRSYFGAIPYGMEKVGTRTADKRLAQMSPMDLGNLSMVDPAAANVAAERLQTLEDRAAQQQPLPGQDQYEGVKP